MPIECLNVQECSGCGVCVAVCPADVLRMDDEMGVAVVRYPEDCLTCFRCELKCPTGCIEVGPPAAARDDASTSVAPLEKES